LSKNTLQKFSSHQNPEIKVQRPQLSSGLLNLAGEVKIKSPFGQKLLVGA
jgi:hypothetical protein